ncbi:hypothetical protein BB558_007365 [Smittium angustum]|uniref:Uncharacterized protein n=1 Tax=Smittium angustum TaxID=133377 RepID=A0A2U1IVG2_SMIAN|nr:hypothetical protein BB558_007365 [Smittium angustum]
MNNEQTTIESLLIKSKSSPKSSKTNKETETSKIMLKRFIKGFMPPKMNPTKQQVLDLARVGIHIEDISREFCSSAQDLTRLAFSYAHRWKKARRTLIAQNSGFDWDIAVNILENGYKLPMTQEPSDTQKKNSICHQCNQWHRHYGDKQDLTVLGLNSDKKLRSQGMHQNGGDQVHEGHDTTLRFYE